VVGRTESMIHSGRWVFFFASAGNKTSATDQVNNKVNNSTSSMSQLLTPSPVSPPYSSPLNHANRQPAKRSGSDCNDNLTADPSSYPLIHSTASAKKGRLYPLKSGEEDMHNQHLHPHQQHPQQSQHQEGGNHVNLGVKSSLDGNSSCRSTPLTPLSSKSTSDVVSNQDSISCSSPNSPFQTFLSHQRTSAGHPVVTGDATQSPFCHTQSPYYQQPYYHLYPPLAAAAAAGTPHGYHYQTGHQAHQTWTTEFTAGLGVAGHPYQHPFPLTPDGSCAGTTVTDPSAQQQVSGLYSNESGKLLDGPGGKGSDPSASATAPTSYSPQTSMEHHVTSSNGGPPDLLQQNMQTLNGRSQIQSSVNSLNDSRDPLEFPYKSGECDNNAAPSYYTKYVHPHSAS